MMRVVVMHRYSETGKPATQRAHNQMMISHHDASPRAQGESMPLQELQICCLQTPEWPRADLP